MASEMIRKLSGMELLQARRQPDLNLLATSNQQPIGALHIPVAQRKTIATLERSHCRWPIGDPQQHDFYLCGAKTNADDSYCAHHRQVAYTPASKTKRFA